MTAVTWKDQPRASLDDVMLVDAQMSFFLSGTETLTPIYADPALTVKLPNPLSSDSAGRFRPLWLDLDIDTDATLAKDGQAIWDVQHIEVFPGTETGQPLDDAGDPMPNCVLEFYRAHTNILAVIYDDDTLTGELSNPITSDSDGIFPDIWLNDELQYRVRLLNASGELIYDIDEYQTLFSVVDPSAPVLSGEITDDGGVESDLTWTASTPGTYSIDHYLLYRSIDGGAFSLIATVPSSDPLEYLDTGQSTDVIYRYYVIAVDSVGNQSVQSNTVELSVSVDVIVDVYTSDDTWIKRPGLITADVYVIGGGGGGGSGRRGLGGENLPGGGGGGGGGYSSVTGILAADLGATETVLVGAGGSGGASVSSVGSGVSGTTGGDSSFGGHVIAYGGEGGRGGGRHSGPDGAGGSGDVAGGNGGGSGQGGTHDGSSSTRGGGGGGGGGSRWSSWPLATIAGNGGNGNTAGTQANGGAGSSVATPGDPGDSSLTNEAGGGGGGGSFNAGKAGDGYAGGAGGNYGAGGGGGGCSTNSGTSGSGGDGAGGVVVVVSYFV